MLKQLLKLCDLHLESLRLTVHPRFYDHFRLCCYLLLSLFVLSALSPVILLLALLWRLIVRTIRFKFRPVHLCVVLNKTQTDCWDLLFGLFWPVIFKETFNVSSEPWVRVGLIDPNFMQVNVVIVFWVGRSWFTFDYRDFVFKEVVHYFVHLVWDLAQFLVVVLPLLVAGLAYALNCRVGSDGRVQAKLRCFLGYTSENSVMEISSRKADMLDFTVFTKTVLFRSKLVRLYLRAYLSFFE